MSSARAAIDAYIRAKDENRPYLARCAFAADATLAIDVLTSAIAFPPRVEGREAIAEILVRQFAEAFENVRTFCLASPPATGATRFACPWLVGMSEKSGRGVRVGCGGYDWVFDAQAPQLATSLAITIERMEILAPAALPEVMDWFDRLPYPWCAPRAALDGAPALRELAPLREWLARAAGLAEPSANAGAGAMTHDRGTETSVG